MNNKPTQKELELEIMELEDELAYKKEQLERLYSINTNGRYFLDEGGGVRELIPPVNILAWEKVIRQGNTFKTVEDAEKESDRRALLYEFNQFKNERNDGWTPNWKDFNMSKYFVAADSDGYLKSVSMYGTDSFVQFGYFHNYKDCMDAIEKFGDRIKELYID
nr:MAG TPA: hypothetical protein [Caudoviricetes sp.]